MPGLNIETAAAKVPTTLMHLHYVNVKLSKKVDKDKILSTWKKYNRIILFSFKDGIKSTAQVMDYARDIGRSRGDLFEIAVWNSIRLEGDTLSYFQAVHQESDVVPENVDAIRAMFDIESQEKSIAKTDKSLGIFSR
jgi:glyceraldehyde-3-phosphate dehydrogenase (NAD(P))